MKKICLWAGALLAVAAAAAGWLYFPGAKRPVVVFANGESKPLSRAEADAIQKQLALPGNSRPPTAVPAADLRRNLDTVDQVNRINQMNKRQNTK